MKILCLIILVLSTISTNIFGQKTGFRQGYIITNSHDSIQGFVKYINKMPARVLIDIKFKKTKKSNTKTYPPNSLKGFTSDDRIYYSLKLPGKSNEKRFFELLIDGYLKLYLLEASVIGTPDYSPSTSSNYYLYKTGDKELYNVNFNKFKSTLSEYLKDDKELSEKIKNGEFKKKELGKIVMIYNYSKYLIKAAHNGEHP